MDPRVEAVVAAIDTSAAATLPVAGTAASAAASAVHTPADFAGTAADSTLVVARRALGCNTADSLQEAMEGDTSPAGAAAGEQKHIEVDTRAEREGKSRSQVMQRQPQ